MGRTPNKRAALATCCYDGKMGKQGIRKGSGFRGFEQEKRDKEITHQFFSIHYVEFG